MKISLRETLKISAATLILCSGIPIVEFETDSGAAFAKSEKSKGGGNGGGSDRASSGGRDRSEQAPGRVRQNGTQPQAAAEVRTRPAHPHATRAVSSEPVSDEIIEYPKTKTLNAALGALNAAHASPQAFANASPNSRVGRIAAYRDSILDTETLTTSLNEAITLLEILSLPDVSSDILASEQLVTLDEMTNLRSELAQLKQALIDIGGVDETLENAIADTQSLIALKTVEISDYNVQIQEAELQQAIYDDAVSVVGTVQMDLDTQEALSQDLLLAAANKEITPQVVAGLHILLGLAPPIAADDEEIETID